MQGTRKNFLLGLFGDLGIQEKEASLLNPGCDIFKDQTNFPGGQNNWISPTRWNHSVIFLWDLLQVISWGRRGLTPFLTYLWKMLLVCSLPLNQQKTGDLSSLHLHVPIPGVQLSPSPHWDTGDQWLVVTAAVLFVETGLNCVLFLICNLFFSVEHNYKCRSFAFSSVFHPLLSPPFPFSLHAGDHSSFCLKCFSFSVFQNVIGSLLLHAEQGGTADAFSFPPQKVDCWM